jgi:gentisate 1,2-dioxygenase
VLSGRGNLEAQGAAVTWSQDDVITLPSCESIAWHADTDAAIYWVNDSPLLRYLGVRPARTTFNPVHYEAGWLRSEVKRAAGESGAASRNRIGILLANPACPLTMTTTPTLWSLLEVVPAGMTLPPHRHNSVALDLAIRGSNRGFTLMGPEIDTAGKIKNPVRVDWSDGSAFTTPAMLWHEHHNEGDEEAWVFPVQDAGLVTYDRILEIKFAAGGPAA